MDQSGGGILANLLKKNFWVKGDKPDLMTKESVKGRKAGSCVFVSNSCVVENQHLRLVSGDEGHVVSGDGSDGDLMGTLIPQVA